MHEKIDNHLYQAEEDWIMAREKGYDDIFHKVRVCMNIYKRYMHNYSKRVVQRLQE